MATRSKTAKQWPNKLGWDVGRAEVRDCVSFYRAFTPATPDPETRREQHRRMDFPKIGASGLFGVDPVVMVRRCEREGERHYDW